MNTPEANTAVTRPREKQPAQAALNLKQEIKKEFEKAGTQEAVIAEKYIEVLPDVKVQAEQTARLSKLTKLISPEAHTTNTQPVKQSVLIEKTQEAAAELSMSNSAQSFQKLFYSRFSQITNLSEETALPYARIAVQFAESESNDPILEGKRKITKAFQIIIAETGKTEMSKQLLFQVIDSINETHFGGVDKKTRKQIQQFVQSHAQKNGLDDLETSTLLISTESPEGKKGRGRAEVTSAEDLLRIKNSIFEGLPPKDQKLIDLYVLSLTSELVRYLVKEEGDIPAKVHQLFQDLQIKWRFSLQPNRLEHVQNLVVEYFSTVKKDIRAIYVEEGRIQEMGSMYFYPGNAFNQKIREWNEDDTYIAAYLMIHTQNPFYLKEYFRGRLIDPLMREIEMKPEVLENKNIINLSEVDLEKYLFGELQQMYFISRRGGKTGNSALGGFYHGILEVFNFARDISDIEKNPLFLGLTNAKDGVYEGNSIVFQVEDFVEDIGGQVPFKRSNRNSTFKMLDLIDAFVKQTKRVEGVLGSLERVSEQMKNGELETALKTAGEVVNNDIDFIVRKAPAIMAARSSYMRTVRQKLAENRGILTADFFKEPTVGMNDIDSDANNAFCAAYRHLSTPEQDLYYEAGKALAIIDGDFLFELANSLPDNNFKVEDVPATILEKIKRGEPLGLADFEFVKRLKVKNPHDFPFRGILNQINYLKWLDQWAVGEPFKLDVLASAPWVSGQGELEPFDLFTLGQKIDRALYMGCNDETVRYFQSDVIIPSLDLNRLIPNMSVAQRGGWRLYLQQLLREDFVREWDEENGMVVSVEKTVDLLLRRAGPMVAYNFIMSPPTSEFVRKGSDISASVKAKMLTKIMQYCRLYHPTLFIVIEKRHLFRENEATFNDSIKNHVLEDLRTNENSHYSVFLSDTERSGSAFKMRPSVFDPPAGVQRDYPVEATQSQEVFHRMMNVMQAAETYISTNKPTPIEGSENQINSPWSLRDFFSDMAVHPSRDECDEKYKELRLAIIRQIRYQQGRRSLKPDKEGEEALFRSFVHFANTVFYGEGKSSIYDSATFLGITMLPPELVRRRKEAKTPQEKAAIEEEINNLIVLDKNGKHVILSPDLVRRRKEAKTLEQKAASEKEITDFIISVKGKHAKRSIEEYYADMILSTRIVNPFDFTYYDNPQLDLQTTGIKLFGRNLSDFEGVLGFYKLMPTIIKKQSELIQQANQEETRKALKGVTDEIQKALDKVYGAYGAAAAYKCGWFAFNYAQRPFVPNRIKDAVLLGALPFIHSYATLMNPNDSAKQNCFGLTARKEQVDHARQKAVISPNARNLFPVELNEEVELVLPWAKKDKHGKKIPVKIPIPKWIAQHIMPNVKYEELAGMKGQDLFDFTLESVMKNQKVDFNWRFLTIFTTVTLVGLVLISFEAIREGMKETEIK